MVYRFRKIFHEALRPFRDFIALLFRLGGTLSLFWRKDAIIVDNAVLQCCGKVIPKNWGDDLNAYFLQEIFHKKFVFDPIKFLLCGNAKRREAYQFIGSIVDENPAKTERIIWGGGIKTPDEETSFENQKFLAVRGPLTRENIIAHGGICPPVYGDPALLLPLFVKHTCPLAGNRHGIGIVSAWWEHKNPVFFDFMKRAKKSGATRIKTRDYKNWRDFIDEICRSEFVVSSSLHGIIVAEAYKIPCVWAVFSPRKMNDGHYFKYRDFYLSIGKKEMKPVLISETTTIDELKEAAKNWVPGKIDLNPLIACCPFPLDYSCFSDDKKTRER